MLRNLLGTANHVFIIGCKPRRAVRPSRDHWFRERFSTALRDALVSPGSNVSGSEPPVDSVPGWATAAVGIGGIVGRLIGSSAVESAGVGAGAGRGGQRLGSGCGHVLRSADSGGLVAAAWLDATRGDGEQVIVGFGVRPLRDSRHSGGPNRMGPAARRCPSSRRRSGSEGTLASGYPSRSSTLEMDRQRPKPGFVETVVPVSRTSDGGLPPARIVGDLFLPLIPRRESQVDADIGVEVGTAAPGQVARVVDHHQGGR